MKVWFHKHFNIVGVGGCSSLFSDRGLFHFVLRAIRINWPFSSLAILPPKISEHCFPQYQVILTCESESHISHGNVFLRFCILYCSQGNREQPARYLKQTKTQENVSVCTGRLSLSLDTH